MNKLNKDILEGDIGLYDLKEINVKDIQVKDDLEYS